MVLLLGGLAPQTLEENPNLHSDAVALLHKTASLVDRNGGLITTRFEYIEVTNG